MMRRALCVAYLAGAAATATGCGFRLQGSGPLPAALTKTYFDTPEPNSVFAGSLRDALRRRGAELVESRQDADAILSVTADDTGQRVLSVTARNLPREYEIYYTVTVSVQSRSEQLMAPEALVVTRSYTYDETQVLGKSAEERVLRQALADDLARQVLRRIEAVTARSSAPTT